ncbi:MAG: PEP-CTERM sorting domain-containing protein, partial [Pseudomonadota bacterium]
GADATFTMTTFTLDQSLLGGFFGPPPPLPLITLGDGLPDQSFWESFGDVPFAPGLTIKDFLISNLVISLDQCDPLSTFCPLDRQAIVTSLVTDIDVAVASVTPVPLPATLPLSMLALGAAGLALRKRKAC